MAAKRRQSGSAPSPPASSTGASRGGSTATPAQTQTTAVSRDAVDYGLDDPIHVRRLFTRGAWWLAFGIAMWLLNRAEYPGPSLSLLLALGVIGLAFMGAGAHMIWSSRTGKIALRDRLVSLLSVSGDAKVLDAGCGRGLMAIAIAKQLPGGKVTAADIWEPSALLNNSGDETRENCRIEAVTDRVRVEQADMRKLSYASGSFDTVVSTFALHVMPDEPDRDEAVRELYRVLKPGGQILLADTAHTGRYAEILRDCGASEIRTESAGFLWCRPARVLTAQK